VSKFAEEHLLLFEPQENQFYAYDQDTGLWVKRTVQGISDIERKRTKSLLDGLMDQLRGRVEKSDAFKREGKVIHLRNGMLHLDVSPPELRSFSPHYYSRNQPD
jgi:hypothetical protein